MKKSILFKTKLLTSLLILATIFSCVKKSVSDETDPIVGKWFLTTVNGADVSSVECYSDSYIDSSASNITFFIQDREENGDCTTLVNNTQILTIQDGFYYLGEEALEIYISGSTLTWVVDADATLIFKK
jgi:hypothetical protein